VSIKHTPFNAFICVISLANLDQFLLWCTHLSIIVCEPMFTQALIETHDDVASKNFEVVPPEAYPLITGETIIPQSLSSIPYNSAQNLTQDAVRMVGIRKNPEESLVMYFSFTFIFIYCYTLLLFFLHFLHFFSELCVGYGFIINM